MSKYKSRIIGISAIAVILIASFIFGGNIPKEAPQSHTPAISPVPITEQTPSVTPPLTPPPIAETPKKVIPPKAAEAPAPNETTPQPSTAAVLNISEDLTCTISITCNTVLSNMSFLSLEKQSVIPKDGVILAEKTAVFYEGESVFNVLAREARQNNIHLEFVNVPFYNSAYIEGIGNLYEFDCGELSGWMYKVNGQFPRFGCSQYAVKKGDKIEWVYTCNKGTDVGDNSGEKNGFNEQE